MLGLIILLVSIFTTGKLFLMGYGLWIISLIVTLYLAHSYFELMKEDPLENDSIMSLINLVATLLTLVFFVISFFI